MFDTEVDKFQKDLKKETLFDRIIFQTPMMNEYYKKFSDIVFMDASYKTNKYDMQLTVFSGVNSEN